MPPDETRTISGILASARIIALAMVIAFCYWASTVVLTLLIAVLMAYFLDPVVTGLEKIHIPRALGALCVVLVTLALIAALGWLMVDRMDQFGRDWPQYRAPVRSALQAVQKKMEILEQRVSEIEPQAHNAPKILTVAESHPIRNALLGKLNSLYTFLFAATFVPFLLFFMLAAKRQVMDATMQLFPPDERERATAALADVTRVLRGYVVGTALVALMLVGVSWLFFWSLGLDFPFLTALVSGLCNLIPYIGAILSWVPPFLVGLKRFHTPAPFVGIFAVLTFVHIITANLLIPALIGWRVRLNALALTISLLFWGWLWGALGLLLAIPITAVLKVICDNVERWRPVGRWLSA